MPHPSNSSYRKLQRNLSGDQVRKLLIDTQQNVYRSFNKNCGSLLSYLKDHQFKGKYTFKSIHKFLHKPNLQPQPEEFFEERNLYNLPDQEFNQEDEDARSQIEINTSVSSLIRKIKSGHTVELTLDKQGADVLELAFDKLSKLRRKGMTLTMEFIYDDAGELVTHQILSRVFKDETIKRIRNAIRSLNGHSNELYDDFTSSEEAIMFALLEVKAIRLRWVDGYMNDQDVGFFPFINKTGIDLSFAAIYSHFDPSNYSENCLFKSLSQSGEFTDEQLQQIKISNQSRYVYEYDIESIATTFNKHITIHRVDVDGHKVKPLEYGNPSSPSKIKLLIRFNHVMLYRDVPCCAAYLKNKDAIDKMEKINPARKCFINRFDTTGRYSYGKKGMDLNEFITLALDLKLLLPFNDPQYITADKFLNYIPAFDNLNYSPESTRPYKCIDYKQKYNQYLIQ